MEQDKKTQVEFFIKEEPILVLNKEGFFYKGEKIEDVHNIYERFNEWMTAAEKEKITS